MQNVPWTPLSIGLENRRVCVLAITYSGMLNLRSVNSNLMSPPSDDAYGHKAKFSSSSPRMRQNFHARSGRLSFLQNFARKSAADALDPINKSADVAHFGRHPTVAKDDVVPGQIPDIQLQRQLIVCLVSVGDKHEA